jgi:two-component system NtrC family sensor kinase
MGVRIAVVIALTTLVSYLHILRSMRAQALSELERHVSERSAREQAIFVQAEDNHRALQQALAERIQAWRQQDPGPRFSTLFVQRPDGSIRNQPQGFDGTKMPGVYIPRGVRVDDELRRRLLAAYEVTAQYGPAFHVRFTDTFILLPEGAIAIYWPAGANWSQEVDSSYAMTTLPYFTDAFPENNPRRQTVWTGIYEDTPTKMWMVSVTTPLDLDGRHVATLGHDMLLDELMTRTVKDHLPSAYNLLFRDDGQLIAHPELMESNVDVPPEKLGTEEQRKHLRALIERVQHRRPEQRVLELPEYGEYIAVARLQGPGWNFVTVLPKSVVSSEALSAAHYVLLFGLASLVLELVIMSWVLRQQITRPLLAFAHATDQVASGDFQVTLESSRDDELGRLAQAFQLMAHEVQRREEALKQSNEGLEQRVETRTRELRELHRQLVETARRAGMAEIATNVLHNVGNVLTSVTTSAMVAKERLVGLKLEQVGRVASLLQEHQDQLGTFLTQDERGRNVLPFLSRLGLHMRDEHQALFTLLDEIGRHIEHIDTIVKRQQTYAKAPQMQEPVRMEELVEDALRINEAGLARHSVQVERSLTPLPPMLTDKHKVLTILVNLISNAKYALAGVPVEQGRRLTLQMEPPSGERLRIHIVDNGLGISPEMFTRIFQYGFTTREEGHGFGLHSSALAAQELGGSLKAHSEGPGHGATFTLELPFRPAEPGSQEPPRA